MVPTNVRELRHRLAELVARYGVPGVSVSVLADGEVTDAAAGVVNVRTGVDVRTDISLHDPVDHEGVDRDSGHALVDEGLVDLDEPVSRYLPGFHTADRGLSATITIRHLLTHTGGFEGDIWAPTTCDPDALELFVSEHVARAPQYLSSRDACSLLQCWHGCARAPGRGRAQDGRTPTRSAGT